MPSASSTRRAVSSVTFCGRQPTSPVTRTVPSAGVSSPAISFSRVDFPDPLTPTRPVLPGPKATWRSSKTAVPSGQAKEREVQVTGGLDYAELNSVMGGSR